MEKVRLGIVGCGSMGSDHLNNILTGKVSNMAVGAICDISEERREQLKAQHPEIPVFADAEELYKSGTCDAVIIATPHYEHPTLVMKAFEYGLHAISEKPAGVYTKQVKEMNEAAKKSGKVFGIMYNQRTIKIYQKIRKMVQSGELGHIKRISWTVTQWYRPQAYHDSAGWRSTWKTEGGGTLINQNPHQLDLFQWMFGMPDKITAFAGYGRYYDIEVEDDVTAFFEYESGTTATYITSTGEFPGTNRLEIACDMGRLVAEGGKLTFKRNTMSEREFNKINEDANARPECWTCDVPVNGEAGNHSGILKNFADAILHGTELLAPGIEGINGLTISNAIHLSSWKGAPVDVKNFPDDEFYEMLQEKIKNSKVDKSHVKNKVNSVAGTF